MADFYVDAQNGNDSTGDGSSGNPWATIGKAVATVPNGSAGNENIVHVRPGYYTELVNVTGGTFRTFTTDGGFVFIDRRGLNIQCISAGGSASNTKFIGFFCRCQSTSPAVDTQGDDITFEDITSLNDGASASFRLGGGASGVVCERPIMRRCIAVQVAATTEGAVRLHNRLIQAELDHCSIYVVVGLSTTPAVVFDGVDESAAQPSTAKVKECVISTPGTEVYNVQGDWTGGPSGTTFPNRYLAGSNRNVLHNRSGGNIAKVGVDTYATISAWQTFVSPDDANSISSDPQQNFPERLFFTLKSTSPALTLDGNGSFSGARGRGMFFGHDDSPSIWGGFTVVHGTGETQFDAANKIENVANPGTFEIQNISLPANLRIKRISWLAEEDTATAGDNARVQDRTVFVSGTPNPMEIGLEVNNSTTPTPAHTNRERDRAFTGNSGSKAHLIGNLRTNARVRA